MKEADSKRNVRMNNWQGDGPVFPLLPCTGGSKGEHCDPTVIVWLWWAIYSVEYARRTFDVLGGPAFSRHKPKGKTGPVSLFVDV